MHRFTVTRGARFALASALVLTGALGLVGSQWTPPAGPAPAPAQVAAGEPAGERYIPGNPSGGQGESQELLGLEDYWNARVTYPTGKYDATWLLRAAAQDKAIAKGVPAGKVTYNKATAASSLSLDPNSWTALGPQPLQSNGCTGCYSYGHVSGRVNSIAVDPVTPNVAYLATVGGGVWKTTNCCTASHHLGARHGRPADLDHLASIDIVIDPSNHNNVYAGTGDLNFGSFSMGSAGVLKSTDAGATWTVQGRRTSSVPSTPSPPGSSRSIRPSARSGWTRATATTSWPARRPASTSPMTAATNWTGPCLPDAFRHAAPGRDRPDPATTTAASPTSTSRSARAATAPPCRYNLAENGANGIYKTTDARQRLPGHLDLISRPDNGWPAGTGSGMPVYQAAATRWAASTWPSRPATRNYIYAQVQAINPGNRGSGCSWASGAPPTAAPPGSSAPAVSRLCTGCAGDYTQNWYDQDIAVDPNNPDIVFMDTFDIWKSTDGGTTFTDITCGYNGGTHRPRRPARARLRARLVQRAAGRQRRRRLCHHERRRGDSPTFTQLNNTLNTIEFYSGDITANFATSASPGANAGAQDNGSAVNVWTRHRRPGHLWQLRKGGDGMFARIEPVLGQRWYQESQNGSLGVSTTGPYGALVSATGGWTADTLSFIFPYEIYKNDCPPTGCTHMIAGSNRVWETHHWAACPRSSWYTNSPNLTKHTLADRSFINQLSYSVSMSTTAIVGTNDGNVQYGFGLGQGTPTPPPGSTSPAATPCCPTARSSTWPPTR